MQLLDSQFGLTSLKRNQTMQSKPVPWYAVSIWPLCSRLSANREILFSFPAAYQMSKAKPQWQIMTQT